MELTDQRFESRAEVQALLREVLVQAAERAGRELCWLDTDFSAWPLSDAAVQDSLRRWALPHRRLHLLAADYEPLRRAHPSFVRWRQLHDHIIDARAYQPEDLNGHQAQPQGLLLAPGWLVLKLWNPSRASLSVGKTPEEVAAREWFDAIEQRSSASFASSTLGL